MTALFLATCLVAADAFEGARWVWPQELGAVTNTTVEFRARFRAKDAVPVRLAIAADTVFAASLNGETEEIGRFPDVPPRHFFDTVDMGRTRSGDNELKIRLYVQGQNSFQYIPGRPGAIFRLFGEGLSVPSGRTVDWRLSARDQRKNVPLVTSQLGFSFVYDAAKSEGIWQTIGPDDLGPSAADLSMRPYPVPRCVVLPEVRERIVAQGRLDGAPPAEDIAAGMDGTTLTPVAEKDFFLPDGKGVREDLFERGFYVIVDLGREEAGLLSLDVDTDAGVTLDIGHAEHLENGRVRTVIGKRAFAGRYRTAEGRQTYCRWARRMAGRYIQLHVKGVRTHFILHRLTVKPVEFPVRERPVPDVLKGVERDIWRTCVRTLRLCMHEHYEDCPWREQALYANDSRNQMLSGYFAFGDENRMPEHCISLLSEGLDETGWVSLCVPAAIGRRIPSFTFSWVLAVDDHLKYRRNPAFTRSMMPKVKQVLDSRIAELKDGLLPCPRGNRYWQFYDWARDLDNSAASVWEGDRFDAPLNLFCILALEAGARCAEATDDGVAAGRWRTAAAEMRSAVRARFWNAREGRIETGLDRNLAPAELVQALALLADVVPQDCRTTVARKLLSPSDWTETTLSQSLYKYEALLLEGGEIADRAVESMTAVWKEMLDKGATSFWEVKDGYTAFGNAASLCHGWSAIPIYIYAARTNRSPDVDAWHGVNLLGLFSWSPAKEPSARFPEHEFRWLSGWGFNFARLPIDYRYLMEANDWTKLKEDGFRKVDEAVAFGRKHGVHVQVCLHRAPGYTIVSWTKDTPLRLQADREPQEAFLRVWREFARRYRGIPNRELTFNLVNEPSGFTDEEYIGVFGRTIGAIRAIDPERFVMLDGNRTASRPVPHFYKVPLTGQAFRGYTPHAISHYGASYIKEQPPVEPVWPLSAEMATNRVWIYEQPEATMAKYLGARKAGYPIMIGEFGCYNKVAHATALAWMESCLKLWKKEGLGWAVWNLTGPFGFVDSNRSDVAYEDFEGHKLDRKMLELLRKYAVKGEMER